MLWLVTLTQIEAFIPGIIQAQPTTFSSSVPIAGLPFQVKVNGVGFDKINDRIVVIDSNENCGAQPTEHDVAYYSNIPCDLPGAAPTLLICGPILLTRKAEYTVCTCNSAINSCDQIAHYSHGGRSNGVFDLHGPISEEHTLRAGVAGSVLIHGHQFAPRDRFRVLPEPVTCSSDSVQDVPDVLEGVAKQRSTGGADYSKWDGVVMATAGEYTLCWCSGKVETCSSAMYTVPMGTLIVEGPELRAPVQWTTGLTNVVHLYGIGLLDTDRIRIRYGSHVCGGLASTRHSSHVLRTPSEIRNAGNGAASHWGSVVISFRGDYVVCWCGREAGVCTDCCERDQDFNILAQTITVSGPEQGIFVQGIAGRPFTFTMSNTLPGPEDRIRLVSNIDTCTSGTKPVTVFRTPAGPPVISGNKQSWVMWISYESLIRVCWCPEAAYCTNDDDFTVSVALIEFIGPVWKEVNIIKNAPFTLSIASRKLPTGESILQPTDRFRIVNKDVVNCGGFGANEHSDALSSHVCWPTCEDSPLDTNPTSLTGTLEEWNPLMLTELGSYRVCWCASNNNCTGVEDFVSNIMHLNVVGVHSDQSLSCASMKDCKISITADGALQITDKIQLIAKKTGNICGRTERISVNNFEYGTRIEASPPEVVGASVEREVTFDLGEARQPGIYRVCYCQSYENCLEDVHYFQNAGLLRVSGISYAERTHMCYMKTDCIVTLLGTLLIPDSDALMVMSEHAECGSLGSSFGTYFRGSAFPLDDGSLKFLGDEGPRTTDDLISAQMKLGLPTRAGKYALCYCDHRHAIGTLCQSRQDFSLAAGFLRIGGVDFKAQVTCMQGEQCSVGLVGNFGDDDEILIIRYVSNITCGSSDAEPATGFSWNPARSADGVVANAQKNNRLELHFNLPRVDKPGKFRLCLCGKGDVESCKTDEWWEWKHEAGVLNVLGVIHEIRPYLLTTPRIVSVEVETVVGQGGIHCSVALRGLLDYFTVPTTDQLIDCLNEDTRRSPTDEPMPLCIARASLKGLAIVGTNVVHIPLTGYPTEKVHVWCFTDLFCQSKRCVSPPTPEGLVVNIDGTLRPNNDKRTTVSVGLPFDLRVATLSPSKEVRVKIVENDGSCETSEMSGNVNGITCGIGVFGKCDPEPKALTGEVAWRNLLVNVPNVYQICYCDRHDTDSCVIWEESGRLEAQGPMGQPSFESNPGSELVIGLVGHGFGVGDRIRIMEENVGCYVPDAPANNETRRLSAVWQSGAPVSINATYEEWRVRLNVLGAYTVCWCGGAHLSDDGSVTRCVQPSDYTLNAGSISVAERRDCVMSEVIVIDPCSKPCGGGTRREKRRVVTEAKGGGVACTADAEAIKTVGCNEDPCPLARLDKAEFEPVSVVQGEAFTIKLHGMYLSNEDRLLIVEDSVQCGHQTDHKGGSTCHVINRLDDGLGNELKCGDGLRSIIIQAPGNYRVCFCDATAAILRNEDGSNGINSSPMSNQGVFSAGCSTTIAYVLSPSQNDVFTVLKKIDSNDNAICSSFAHAANCALHSHCTWKFDRCELVQNTILGMPQNTFVTTCCIVGAGVVILLMLFLYRRNNQKNTKVNPYMTYDTPQQGSRLNLGTNEDIRAAQEHYQMMQQWDTYYQSMGYPPGTAWLMHGQDNVTSPTKLEAIKYDTEYETPNNNNIPSALAVPPQPMLPLMNEPARDLANLSSTSWGEQLKNLPLGNRPTSPAGGKFAERVRRASMDVTPVTVKPTTEGSTTPRIPMVAPSPTSPPIPPKPKPYEPVAEQIPPQEKPKSSWSNVVLTKKNRLDPIPHSGRSNDELDQADLDSLALSSDNSRDVTPRFAAKKEEKTLEIAPPTKLGMESMNIDDKSIDGGLRKKEEKTDISLEVEPPTKLGAGSKLEPLEVAPPTKLGAERLKDLGTSVESEETEATVALEVAPSPTGKREKETTLMKGLSSMQQALTTLRRRKKVTGLDDESESIPVSPAPSPGPSPMKSPISPSMNTPASPSSPSNKRFPHLARKDSGSNSLLPPREPSHMDTLDMTMKSDVSLVSVSQKPLQLRPADPLDESIKSEASLVSMRRDPLELTTRSDVSLMTIPQAPKSLFEAAKIQMQESDPQLTARSDVSQLSMPKPPPRMRFGDEGIPDFDASSTTNTTSDRRPPPPPPPPGRRLPPPPKRAPLDLDASFGNDSEKAVMSPNSLPRKLSLGGSAARSNAVHSVNSGRRSPSPMSPKAAD